MMNLLDNFNISLGKWFGIPVTLHWSWVLMVFLILLWKPELALVIVGVFFIVLLHECGHCIAAQKYNVPVKDIVLYPFGGAARIQLPSQPVTELVVAISGPFVNVILIGPLFLAAQFHDFFMTMFFYNIVLLVFNMIPAFPMDGGRVLRSILSMFLLDYFRATWWAVRIGQIFSVLFIIGGFLLTSFALPIIGIFIYISAQAELDSVETHSRIKEIKSYFEGVRNTSVLDEEIEAANESLAIITEFQRQMGDIDRRYRDN